MDDLDLYKLTFDDRDEFHRRPIAEKAISLLLSDAEVSPLIIDGKWGTGKTEFCHKLINLIKDGDDNASCLYVDAFRADNADSALTTLIAEVANLIEDDNDQSQFIEKAIPAVRYGLKTIGKAGVSWVLKQNADDIADEYEDIIKKAGEDSINVAIEQLIRDHQEALKNLETLREALTEVAAENPIIMFVDELDRCKPDFSVSVLETIKHIFDVENVQFVLIANLSQLKDTINHCYGVGVDAQRYLDKFIKFSFKLSPLYTTDQHNFNYAAVSHARNLIHSNESLAGLRSDGYINLIETLIRTNNLSLREVETFIRYIDIYNILCENNGFPENLVFGYGLLRLLAIYYFCFHNGLCEKINSGYIDGIQLTKILHINSHVPRRDLERRDSSRILATLIFLESTTSVEGLDMTDEEDLNQWEEDIRSLFRGFGFAPERGERVKILSDTIQKLQMTI